MSKNQCRGCRKVLKGPGTKKFCSYTCRYEFYLRKSRELHRRPYKNAKCKECGSDVSRTNRRKFCSPACYVINQRKQVKEYAAQMRAMGPKLEKLCILCGKKQVDSPKSLYCGSECRETAIAMGYNESTSKKIDEQLKRHQA